MLAYTAVDGLRAISRDFDLDWQPSINDGPVVSSRAWHRNLRPSGRLGAQVFAAILALLPLGAIVWQR